MNTLTHIIKAFFPDTLRGRYVFIAISLFLMLAITAMLGWYTVQNVTSRHQQKMKDQASVENTIHDFTVLYQDVKYALLEFLIQPDAQNYQLYNETLINFNDSYESLKLSQQQRKKNTSIESTISLDFDIEALKSELVKIIRVRLDAEQTFPFTTIMLSISDKNGEILSAIDSVATLDTSPDDYPAHKLKQLFIDTRYTWVRLMAEFRLLVAVRFGIFTGAWQPAFEQRVYNVQIYMKRIQDNINQLTILQNNNELPLEVENDLLVMTSKVNGAIKQYQDAIILLRSPRWRQDLLLLADYLRPAFTKLDTSLQLLHQKEENNWLISMSELTSLARQLSNSLWVLLIICSMLVLFGYIMFDKTILSPIRKVALALKDEASGYPTILEKYTSAKEINILTDAFHDMRQQVNSRQQRLINILDNAAEAIITIEKNGIIETFNAAAENLFGYHSTEMLGKNVLALIPENTRDYYHELFILYQYDHFSTRSSSGIEGYEIDILCKNQTLLPVSIKISKTVIDGQLLYTGLVVDISERLANELERQQRLAEMAHVGRLSIMGEMAAGIAHELNQPLAAMSLYLQGSLRRSEPGVETCKDITKAVKSAIVQVDRAGDIIRKMRGFARRESFHRETVNINELIHKSVSLVLISQQNISPKPELILNDMPLMVNVDILQIEQVLVNLIRNAYDAISQLEVSKRNLQITSIQDDSGFARVIVIDSGDGVLNENQHKIFDTYFTTKSEGLGMGLSICRSIIEEHNGTLWYQPGTDTGSQFCFTLPLADANSGSTKMN